MFLQPPINGTLDNISGVSMALRDTLLEMQDCAQSVIRPIGLYTEMKRKTGHCTDGHQHDSH